HTRDIPGLNWRMSPAERTLADEFNEGGYHTAYIGKWHLEGCRPVDPIPRSRQGRWQKWLGFELRNSHFDTFYFEDDDPSPKPLGKYQTDGLFDLAIDHIADGRPKDKPFLCLLSVEPPHFPYEAPEQYERRWRERDIELPPSFETQPEYEIPLSSWDGDDTHTAQIKKERVRTYYAMIENLDDNVGRMMEFLKEEGLADNTVVLLVSDHGEMGGMHKLPTAMKNYPFEESVGIPLIIRDPRLAALSGRRTGEPVNTEDLFPTICGLVGLKPKNALPGEDLTPLIEGSVDQLDRNGVLLEFVRDFRDKAAFYKRSYRAFRSRRYMYSVLDGKPWQFFDLEKDPHEMNNLVDSEAHKVVIGRHHKWLREKLIETDDHFHLQPAFGQPGLNLPQEPR
ncbi:MAG: sulfatase-like hydrolase/transferase, partial [Candidatus Sumerlaeota bacterium]